MREILRDRVQMSGAVGWTLLYFKARIHNTTRWQYVKCIWVPIFKSVLLVPTPPICKTMFSNAILGRCGNLEESMCHVVPSTQEATQHPSLTAATFTGRLINVHSKIAC